MELHPFVVFLSGLLILITGAELLLRNASRLADMLGISPLVIGLTIVAMGTSIPELAVGITAATEGRGSLAVGNVAGANIVNILCILGLTAVIRPIPLRQMYLKLDFAVMAGAAVALLVMALDGLLTPLEGLLLVLGAILYTVAILRTTQRREAAETSNSLVEESPAHKQSSRGWGKICWISAMLLLGIAITIGGANLLVSGAVELAQAYGVSDAFIGLTIVAIGTTAPEFATAMLATIRNKRNVAVGTLIGSFIYNILVILGVSMMFSADGIPLERNLIWLDLPIMVAVAMLCIFTCRNGRSLTRKEGVFFVLSYLLYLGALLIFRT